MLSNVHILYGLCIATALFLSKDFVQGWFFSGKESTSRQSEQPPVPVKILQVENSPIPLYLNFAGVLKSRNSVQLKAEKPGRVIFVNQNEFCKKGDVIIKLDSESEEAQLLRNEGALQKATDALKRAQDRAKQPGVVSSAEMNTYESEFKSALGQMKTAEADLRKMTMYAEFDAKLGIPNVSIGSRINQNDVIMAYTSHNDFIIDFAISEVAVKDVYAGKKINVASPMFNGLREAVIEKVDPTADATYVIRVRASLSGDAQLKELYSGISVKVTILSDQSEAIPNIDERAIDERMSGAQSIYVCEWDGKRWIATKRTIEIGRRSNGRAAVLNLAPGTKYCMPVRGVNLDQRVVIDQDQQNTPQSAPVTKAETNQDAGAAVQEDGDEDV